MFYKEFFNTSFTTKGKTRPSDTETKKRDYIVNCLEILPCVESMNLLNSTWEQKASQ